jgi:hypothetical protein
MKLLPGAVLEQRQPATCDELAAQASGGAIDIELPGRRAVIILEGSVDPSLVRAVLDCTKIHLIAGEKFSMWSSYPVSLIRLSSS